MNGQQKPGMPGRAAPAGKRMPSSGFRTIGPVRLQMRPEDFSPTLRLALAAAAVLAGILLASAGVWILAALPDVVKFHPGGADYKLLGLLVWLTPGVGALLAAFYSFRGAARQVVILFTEGSED